MTVTLIFGEVYKDEKGAFIAKETYAVTGLSASGANTVPFPSALPRLPRRVALQPVGNAAVGAVASLDTSQGSTVMWNNVSVPFAGGCLGADKNNVYLYIGNATQLEMTVEY